MISTTKLHYFADLFCYSFCPFNKHALYKLLKWLLEFALCSKDKIQLHNISEIALFHIGYCTIPPSEMSDFERKWAILAQIWPTLGPNMTPLHLKILSGKKVVQSKGRDIMKVE